MLYINVLNPARKKPDLQSTVSPSSSQQPKHSTINSMANKRTNARAKASKMNASHSWPWVIIRIVQTAVCVIVLGLSIYLRFSYSPTSTNIVTRAEDTSSEDSKDSKDSKDDDYNSAPPWSAPSTKVNNSDDRFYHPIHGHWGFSPYVSLGILMGVSFVSLLSSFGSLMLYCLDKLTLKFLLILDLFLSLGWIAGTVFTGKLITDNMGWGLNDSVANLYKLGFVLAVLAVNLFIFSGGLGFRLAKAAKGSGGTYAPMAMAPEYKSTQTRGETGTHKTYTGPATDATHDVPNKPISDYA